MKLMPSKSQKQSIHLVVPLCSSICSDISVLPDRNMNYSMLAGQNPSSKSQDITVRDWPELHNRVKRDAYRQQS